MQVPLDKRKGDPPHLPSKKNFTKAPQAYFRFLVASLEKFRSLKKAGFIGTHKRGRHLYLTNAEKMVTLPIHGTKDIPAGTLYNIIVRQAGMTVDDFLEL